jgi:hypothetical protein
MIILSDLIVYFLHVGFGSVKLGLGRGLINFLHFVFDFSVQISALKNGIVLPSPAVDVGSFVLEGSPT